MDKIKLRLRLKTGLAAILLAALLGTTLDTLAVTRVWTGTSADGNWFSAGNWNPSATYPQAGDDVVISNAAATVILSNDTAMLGSLMITNTAKLVFTNYAPGVSIILYATNVTVRSGAMIQHSANSAVITNASGQWVPDSRIYIVCTNLTVETNGQINADAAGYKGVTTNTCLTNIGGTATRGYGPGAGGGNGIGGGGRGGGGGYGGRGGDDGSASLYRGVTYGSTNAPDQPGSSGGIDLDRAGTSGAGGGLIRLVVSGSLTNNGSITAIGGACNVTEAGAGSGGGIYITCGTMVGTGSILANGGDFQNTWGGDGGGGRIAIECADSFNWRGSIRAAPGLITNGNPFSYTDPNGRGTLFVTSDGYLKRPLGAQTYYLYGLTNLVCDSLTISNSIIDYMETNLAVTITNDITSLAATQTFVGPVSAVSVRTVTLTGSVLDFGNGLTFTNRMDLTNSVIKARYNLTLPPKYDFNIGTNCQVWVGRQGDTNYMNFQVDGNLNLSTNARLYVFSGNSNSTTRYGGNFSVTGNVTILNGGMLLPYSQPTNGGSMFLTMSNLTVFSNGSVNATAAGYLGNRAGLAGYGPGGGKLVSDRGYGAGYGGTGGFQSGYNVSQAGTNYGSVTVPEQCGSAGGGNSSTLGLSAGGGLIRLDVPGTIILNGGLIANGQDTGGSGVQQRGSGSGGGIYVTCNRFMGSGLVTANGGADTRSAGQLSYNGTGGGGRIAVISRENTIAAGWTGSAQAAPGQTNGGTASYLGTTGTVYWPLGPYVTNMPASAFTFTTATLNGVLVANGTGTAAVAVYWGPVDGGTVKAAWANTNQFSGSFSDGAVVSTNVTGLSSGGRYYYRFTASNAVSEMWAPATETFRTTALSPVVSNLPATQVTTSSATLNGYLSSTGSSPTTVSVLWGTTDAGAAMSGWDHTNTFGVATQLGAMSTNVGLAPASYYYYRYYGTNNVGEAFADSTAVFISGEVTVDASGPNAWKDGPMPVTNTVRRPPSLTNLALTVNYAISGTASNTVDYFLTPPGNSITLAPGVSNMMIIVTPIWDDLQKGDKTVGLSLLPGAYAIGAASNTTVTIKDAVINPGVNATTNAGGWSDKNIWSQGRLPVAGDDVTVKYNVTLTNATRLLNSFTITNAILTFQDTTNLQTCLNANDVRIRNAGKLTHLTNSAVSTNSLGVWPIDARVYVACNTLTVENGGSIDADAKGFGGGAPATNGFGPGGGRYVDTGSGGGGGHGGAGLWAAGIYGGTYDSASQPVWPGSGGSGRQAGETGGIGGGLIRVEATGLVTVNGTVTANGQSLANYAGGGSGGGIYIQCLTFTGTSGVFSANGGNSVFNSGPGGGGGRIAVAYDQAAQSNLNLTARPAVKFSANQGMPDPSNSNSPKLPARPGTLYFPDTGFFPYTNLLGGQIVIPGFTSWSPVSLMISTGIVVMPAGLQLNVGNTLTINGKSGGLELTNSPLTVGGSLVISNNGLADSTFYGGPAAALVVSNDLVMNQGSVIMYSTPVNGSTLRVVGNLVMTNVSALTLSSSVTSSGNIPGALIDVGGDMTVGSNGWVYPISHSTNGGSPYFKMANLLVVQGGGFNANASGFAGAGGAMQNGYGDTNGCGKWSPGGDSVGNGAGYGGNGGGVAGYFGTPYGSASAPSVPGSGGSGRSGSSNVGGFGGGYIGIHAANQVTINGLLSANGQGAMYGGGGSGGGIYVQCTKFLGGGLLSAVGGSNTMGGGSGGGGRIAVVSPSINFTGSTNVNGGVGGSYNGSSGTVMFKLISGTLFMVF